MEELKDITPAFEVTDEAVDNMGCIFAYELRAQGIERLYTEDQMKQAYMTGVDYGCEARESHEELLNSGEAQDEEV
ncbi:hypothetical protein [Lactococcus formosensis]|uniref:hypothetical protein n=1 Tax=Lactococcus formosensis TaxID=1281486 RepID=UPI0032667301